MWVGFATGSLRQLQGMYSLKIRNKMINVNSSDEHIVVDIMGKLSNGLCI